MIDRIIPNDIVHFDSVGEIKMCGQKDIDRGEVVGLPLTEFWLLHMGFQKMEVNKSDYFWVTEFAGQKFATNSRKRALIYGEGWKISIKGYEIRTVHAFQNYCYLKLGKFFYLPVVSNFLNDPSMAIMPSRNPVIIIDDNYHRVNFNYSAFKFAADQGVFPKIGELPTTAKSYPGRFSKAIEQCTRLNQSVVYETKFKGRKVTMEIKMLLIYNRFYYRMECLPDSVMNSKTNQLVYEESN